eukprot:4149310-Pyramimonas_sp.AAC.1
MHPFVPPENRRKRRGRGWGGKERTPGAPRAPQAPQSQLAPPLRPLLKRSSISCLWAPKAIPATK